MFFIGILFFIITIIITSVMVKGKGGTFFLKSRTLSIQEKAKIGERWQKILDLVELPGTSTSSQAVIKADKLLDSVLKKLGPYGDTMGERLKAAQKKFSSYHIYDTAWKAHKIRNTIVHETDFELTKTTAKSVLKQYGRVLKDLRAV